MSIQNQPTSDPWILLIGGTSDIAVATAHRFAKEGWNILLASRNLPTQEAIAADIAIRYEVDVKCCYFDALKIDGMADWIETLPLLPEVAVIAFGMLPNEEEARNDFPQIENLITVNFTAAAMLAEGLTSKFAHRKHGTLIAISSVAGERGRAGNYIYGSTKAALTAWLSGLRARMLRQNIHVMTVLPGFIRTKMTSGMPFPGILTSLPDAVANSIYSGYLKKKNVLYAPWYWRWIMMIIRLIPETVFKRMKL